jgi:tetratricopeptide (TPR) repeat protein
LGLATVVGWACLNDRDSQNSHYAPGAIEATIGWYEVNPPLYYQMRIERIEKKAKTIQLTAQDYDDLAVAYDRSGNDDKAIEWIKRKDEDTESGKLTNFTRAEKVPVTEGKTWIDDRTYFKYSTQANWGTFLVHRWIKRGAKKEEIDQATESLQRLEKAVEINPEAHSEREWAQIAMVRWLIGEKTEPTGEIAEEFMGGGKKTIAGLAGLVTLGNAWESVDVFMALQTRTNYSSEARAFAYLREQELRGMGRTSLAGLTSQNPDPKELPPEFLESERKVFTDWRKQAEKMKADRLAFMTERLSQGMHPDTDGDRVWEGYHEPEMPRHHDKPGEHLTPVQAGGLVFCFGTVSYALYLYFRGRQGRKPIKN